MLRHSTTSQWTLKNPLCPVFLKSKVVCPRIYGFKPHGSIDWYDVKQGVFNKDVYFVADGDSRVPRSARRLITYYGNELPLDIDGESHSVFNCAPAIMPPTFAKRFEYIEQRVIWQDVNEVCARANEFVFLGYSLPMDDYLTRAAIRRSLSRKNHVDRKKVRCLVVSRPPAAQTAPGPTAPDKLLSTFQEVFGLNVARDKNFLDWNFGKPPGDLMRYVSKGLKRASC